jgi:hypothetical protein
MIERYDEEMCPTKTLPDPLSVSPIFPLTEVVHLYSHCYRSSPEATMMMTKVDRHPSNYCQSLTKNKTLLARATRTLFDNELPDLSQVKWYYLVVCMVDCHVDRDQGGIIKETGDYTEYVNCDCPYRRVGVQSVGTLFCPSKSDLGITSQLKWMVT